MWLKPQGRLLTKERLLKIHVHVETVYCCLYEAQAIETNYHLFVECHWLKIVRSQLIQWTNVKLRKET